MAIEIVEADLVATLKAAAGSKVRQVESLPGDWDDDMLKRVLGLVPCLLVTFAGGAPRRTGAAVAGIVGQWIVYVVTGHASGEAARRLGDAIDVGAYELLAKVVVPAVHGHTVKGVGSFDLQRIENLFTGTVERQGLAVYAVTFELDMDFEAEPDADALAPFTTFDTKYDIPTQQLASVHREWLADNFTHATPDGEDKVTLPQT